MGRARPRRGIPLPVRLVDGTDEEVRIFKDHQQGLD